VVKAWKISPGVAAEDWPVCSKEGCIGLGWVELKDFRRFSSQSEVLKALKGKYPEKRGNREGAARSISYFCHIIEPSDIVVATDGRSSVVGIGVVASDYLPPKAPSNPVPVDSDMWRRHARAVRWVITDRIDFNEITFAEDSVHRLRVLACAKIKQAYLKQFPKLKKALDELFDEVSDAADDAEPATQEAEDLDPPAKVATTVYRILRDTGKARRVKFLHNYECQICGETITLADGQRYAEAHHIRPLGREHKGPDTPSNILCLCPNHHAELDLRVKPIKLSLLRIAKGHVVAPEYIAYHNEFIHDSSG
jgi:predicted Mrr-cat superfamily restriction endonuclease